MPMPKFTYKPSPSPRRPRAAKSSRDHGIGALLSLAHGSLLDDLGVARALNDALDEDAGRMNAVRIKGSRLHQLFDLGHSDAGGSGHVGIEITRRLAIDE